MEMMMKEEIENMVQTFEAVGPILGNALKSRKHLPFKNGGRKGRKGTGSDVCPSL
jgi:hypothetical protein